MAGYIIFLAIGFVLGLVLGLNFATLGPTQAERHWPTVLGRHLLQTVPQEQSQPSGTQNLPTPPPPAAAAAALASTAACVAPNYTQVFNMGRIFKYRFQQP